uniref:Uncharacterized protein n=1 Tax=Hanusia phi TaxID=3032 RepID=A0A7S0EI32_9CRYP
MLVALLIAVLAVEGWALTSDDEMTRNKQGKMQRREIPRFEMARDLISLVGIYEMISLSWLLSTWMAAWLFQPSRLGLVQPFLQLIGEPLEATDFRSTQPTRLVDRLRSHFDNLENRAEHALSIFSRCLPLDLRHLGTSYAEGTIFRICAKPVVVPLKVYFSLKVLRELKKSKQSKI